ncbi:MAG: flagellar basal body-associated FliL family protein [Roseovarius sp.]|nr:flagellar basal body-associated FliL family protein [Roseovarius sp.]
MARLARPAASARGWRCAPCPRPGRSRPDTPPPRQPRRGHDRHEETGGADYVKLNNQFVVPVVAGKQVNSLVVMSLSIEIGEGKRDIVYAREPKLRDALLQVLFDHANMGGFAGTFTDGNTLDVLRAALTETARGILGDAVRNVLIVDIARQDM